MRRCDLLQARQTKKKPNFFQVCSVLKAPHKPQSVTFALFLTHMCVRISYSRDTHKQGDLLQPRHLNKAGRSLIGRSLIGGTLLYQRKHQVKRKSESFRRQSVPNLYALTSYCIETLQGLLYPNPSMQLCLKPKLKQQWEVFARAESHKNQVN